MNYKLINKIPVKCDDIEEWAKWMGSFNRTIIGTNREGLFISTVFLGVDHGFSDVGDHAPIVFETMVFEDTENKEQIGIEKYCSRYSTYDEAMKGHVKTCKEYLTSYTDEDLFVDVI